MNTLGIEYVCSANVVRSAMAEVIGREYVQELGLEGRISVYSSGVIASDSDALMLPLDTVIGDIKTGLRNGIFDEKTQAIAEQITVDEPSAEDRRNLDYCEKYVIVDGDTKRNIVLLEYGLVPWGRFHQQTKTRGDVQLILPMTEDQVSRVKEMYDGSLSPDIVHLMEYVGLEDDVQDPVGKSINKFREVRNTLLKAVYLSIEKAVEEFGV